MSTRILPIEPASSEARPGHAAAHGGEAIVVDLPTLQELRAPAERVAQELAGHAPVEVLLLDGCYTAGGFRWDGERWRDPLSTYAGRLGCSVVVSFYDAVNIAQARAFSRHFYERLFAGDSPLAAAVAARRALFLAEAGGPLHECLWWKIRIATGPSRRNVLPRRAPMTQPP